MIKGNIIMNNENGLQRRNFVLAAGSLAVAAATASTNAFASNKHQHHGASHSGLVTASSHCVATGNTCIAHCLMLLGDGDSKMAECAKTVQLMMPMCDAAGYHAAANSKECTACAESCADMIAACKSYLKSA